MHRVFRGLVFVLAAGMAFSSCTCSEDVPPPPETRQRSAGFAAKLPTQPRSQRVAAAPPTPNLPVTPLRDTPTIGEAVLPENFPTDVPVFENAQAFAVQNLAGEAKNVLFYSEGEPRKIYDFYVDKMEKSGWKTEQQYQTREQSFLSFRKGRMIANMTISKDPRSERQIIGIMYQQEDELPFPEF